MSIEKILRHCSLWKDAPMPPPPVATGPPVTDGPSLDYALLSLPFLKRKVSGARRRCIVPLSSRTAYDTFRLKKYLHTKTCRAFSDLMVSAKMIILLEEVAGDIVGGNGKMANIFFGGKGKYTIHRPAPEKSNYLSVLTGSLEINRCAGVDENQRQPAAGTPGCDFVTWGAVGACGYHDPVAWR
jgi:hypothetical protein